MSEIDDLMFLDHVGKRVEEPDGIVRFALDEREYMARIPAVKRILTDPDSQPLDRFLACFTLVAWGEEAGYSALIRAADAPADEPWVGMSTHRIWGVDDTFAQLAEAVDIGNEICEEKGTVELRATALRSLVRLVPEWYFDGNLPAALRPVVADLADDLVRAVRAGLVRLRGTDQLGFDLGWQLADLVVTLTPTDEGAARELADELLRVDRSWTVREELSRVISSGSTGLSRGVAWGLVRRGGPVTWFRVGEAFYRRHWGPSWLR